jgi:hypothetical protein
VFKQVHHLHDKKGMVLFLLPFSCTADSTGGDGWVLRVVCLKIDNPTGNVSHLRIFRTLPLLVYFGMTVRHCQSGI